MDIIQALRRVTLFDPFQDNEIELIAEQCEVEEFGEGDIIIREGETDQDMYIILSGNVTISSEQHDGAQKRLGSLTEAQIFGEIAMLFGMPRSASVTAEDTVECARVSKDVLLPLLTIRPEIGQEIANLIASRETDSFELDAIEDDQMLQTQIDDFLESFS